MLELNKVHNVDCIEGLKEIPARSIDLVVTDPPFFIAQHYQSRINWQRNYGDLTPLKVFWDVVVEQLARVLKKEGHLFVFCNGDSYPMFYEPTYNRFDRLKSLVWDKTRVGLGRTFRNQHELIIWARWREAFLHDDGKLRADVLKFMPTPSRNREHPVEKPPELIAELILPTTRKRAIVLDPFIGAGSTALACIRTNRRFIGMDISKEYCEIANRRLNLHGKPNHTSGH